MNGQDTFLWGLQINDSLTTELTAQMTVIALGGKSSVSCPLKPSDSAPLKHSTMPP